MEKLISGIFSLLLGAGGLWTALRLIKNRKILNTWNTATGRIVERGTHKPNMASISAPAFRYAPLLKYSYEVGGKEYVNDCIYPKRMQLPPRGTVKWAQKRADSYPAVVTVYYNSADPSESYIQLTSRLVIYIVLAISILLLLIGLIILVSYLIPGA